jgi:integral membrane protein
MNLLKSYRLISIAEGISLLLLFGLAMPLKYIYDSPLMVEIVGMLHGLLFIAYVLFSLIYKFKVNWKYSQLAIVLIASLIPFGTFYIDKKYLRIIS